jgi:hypothetical protein
MKVKIHDNCYDVFHMGLRYNSSVKQSKIVIYDCVKKKNINYHLSHHPVTGTCLTLKFPHRLLSQLKHILLQIYQRRLKPVSSILSITLDIDTD